MSVSTLVVAVRSTGTAALARTANQFRALSAAVTASSLATRQHSRAVSSLAGVYQDANGLWRNANGTLLTHRHTVTHVTTAYGRLSRVMRGILGAFSSTGLAVSQNLVPAMTALAANAAVIGIKFGAILAVAFPLVGVIGNLLPLIMLLAPAMAAAGLVAVGLKLAFSGIGAALSAGLSGDAEAFRKALDKLPPPAREAVRAMVELRDAFKPIQQVVQAELFAGAAGELRTLTKLIVPIAETWLPRLAREFGEVRGAIAEGIAKYAADGRLERVWRMIHEAVSNLLDVLPPVARAFGDILEVAAPRFASLTGDIRSAALAFSEWIRSARDSGKLQEWLDKAMVTFGKLRDIAANTMSIISAIFQASSDDGDDMLDQLVSATKAISDWANSGSGQAIINVFSSIFKIFSQLAPLFSAWATWFQGMVGAVKAAWDGISAIFRAAVAIWLGYLEALVFGAAKAFGWIPGIGPKLKAAAAEFSAFKDSVNRALDGIQDETVNITYRAIRVGDHTLSGSQVSGTYSSGIGGRAAGGPVKRGVPYVVGEKRPELFIPDQDGRIAPEVPAAAKGSAWGGKSGSAPDLVVAGGDQGVASLIRYLIRTGALTLAVRNNRVVVS